MQKILLLLALLPPGRYMSETGRIYCSLSMPKVFCYGTKSVTSGTIDFLEVNKLEYQAFDDACHWLMIDKAKEFYSFLYEFIYTGTQTEA